MVRVKQYQDGFRLRNTQFCMKTWCLAKQGIWDPVFHTWSIPFSEEFQTVEDVLKAYTEHVPPEASSKQKLEKIKEDEADGAVLEREKLAHECLLTAKKTSDIRQTILDKGLILLSGPTEQDIERNVPFNAVDRWYSIDGCAVVYYAILNYW